MSKAPPEYRVHLLSTDLRTADDALAWLWERARAPIEEGSAHRMIAMSALALEARLDQERRAACRRGAHHFTRRITSKKATLRAYYHRGRHCFKSFPECMSAMREQRWGYELRIAIALRKAV